MGIEEPVVHIKDYSLILLGFVAGRPFSWTLFYFILIFFQCPHWSSRGLFSLSRITLPYQYSALSQIDADPDDEEELGNLENNLHLLVEDSSSDDDKEGEEEEEEEKPEKTGEKTSKKMRSRAEEIADEGDDDVFADADAVSVHLGSRLLADPSPASSLRL